MCVHVHGLKIICHMSIVCVIIISREYDVSIYMVFSLTKLLITCMLRRRNNNITWYSLSIINIIIMYDVRVDLNIFTRWRTVIKNLSAIIAND